MHELKTIARTIGQKIRSNGEAMENHLFFGAQATRQRVFAGFDDLSKAKGVIKTGRKQHKEVLSGLDRQISELENQLSQMQRNPADYNKQQFEDVQNLLNERRATRERKVKNFNAGMEKHYQQRAQALMDIGGGAWEWASAGDYAGQGLRRVGAIATRIGAPAAGWMGANIGFRYLRGGTATRNPNGERDIAGIPLV